MTVASHLRTSRRGALCAAPLLLALLCLAPGRAEEPAAPAAGQAAPAEAALAAGEEQVPAEPPAIPSRAMLGDAFLRFEEAYFAAPRSAEEARRANEAFDQASGHFFVGRAAEALRLLNTETLRLRGLDPDEAKVALLSSLFVVPRPMVDHRQREFTHILLDVRQQYPLEHLGPIRFTEAMSLRGEDDKIHWGGTLLGRSNPTTPYKDVIVPDFRQKVLAAGRFQLQFHVGEEIVIPAQRLYVTEKPVLELKAALEARLAALGDDGSPERADALVIARGRLALLTDNPSLDWSAQYFANHATLGAEVADEVAALEEGRNPYSRRAGDSWRLLRAEGVEVPYRLFAPSTAVGTAALPVVVALHGAGGDENMWSLVYGAGRLHDLAEEKGFLLVAPLSYPLGRQPSLVGALLDSVGRCYAIDRSRVFLIGHSMGGMVASAAAEVLDPAPAAVAFLASAPAPSWERDGAKRPPALLVGGALDPIIPAARVKARAAAIAAAGLSAEYREEADQGHTLLVGTVLPSVVEWLLQQRGE